MQKIKRTTNRSRKALGSKIGTNITCPSEYTTIFSQIKILWAVLKHVNKFCVYNSLNTPTLKVDQPYIKLGKNNLI